jgi:hypothetical protein
MVLDCCFRNRLSPEISRYLPRLSLRSGTSLKTEVQSCTIARPIESRPLPDRSWLTDRAPVTQAYILPPARSRLCRTQRPPRGQPIPDCIPKKLAGAAGIEPALAVLETAVLPLNYAPVLRPCATVSRIQQKPDNRNDAQSRNARKGGNRRSPSLQSTAFALPTLLAARLHFERLLRKEAFPQSRPGSAH